MQLLAASLGCLLLIGAVPAVPAPAVPDGKDAPVIEHGPRDKRKIALTFDACRTSLPDEYDEQVIDVLVREKVEATIFISGRWADRNPDKTRFLASLPQFEIANHAYFHPHLLRKDDAGVLSELQRTQAVLTKMTGRKPRYFRAPYGEVDDRIAGLAAKAGLVTIQYDLPSGDPDPRLKPEKIVKAILREARSGSIIVFHANRHGVHTAEVLPSIIAGLRQKGYELVTVGELLKEMDTGTGERGDAEKKTRSAKKPIPKIWQSGVCH